MSRSKKANGTRTNKKPVGIPNKKRPHTQTKALRKLPKDLLVKIAEVLLNSSDEREVSIPRLVFTRKSTALCPWRNAVRAK